MRDDVQPLGDLAETLGRLLKNTVFRLSILGAALFGVSLLIAQVIVYDRIVTNELRRVEAAIEAELLELQKIFDDGGRAAFIQARRTGLLPSDIAPNDLRAQPIFEAGAADAISSTVIQRGASQDGLYLFQLRQKISGNLANQTFEGTGERLPLITQANMQGLTKQRFFYSDPYSDNPEFKDRLAIGIMQPIYINDQQVGGIVVGRDIETITRTGERMQEAMAASSLIALFLGILSSIFVARRFARRVEAFNQLATDVRAGHLDRRAPRTYSEDEMDLLAEHLNAMLDHIDRLMQAMRYAGDSVAHDLRTPLTRLRTRLESAAVEAGDSKEADVLFAAAGDAAELLGTFDSVLRIARLEAGERRELLKPLDPKPILDDLAELYEPACEDAGRGFTFDIADNLSILADRGLLSQAVSNLVENAIKYTPEGGRIHLYAKRGPRGRVRIGVADDGPGIPSFDRERVKERFVRLDKSRTLPGSGLGLALVDAVADLHQAEFAMDDGLGYVPSDPESGDAERPGLKVELVFPRPAKPSKRADAATPETSELA